MSRIGRLPILVPDGVKVDFIDNEVKVEGPRGQLSRSFHPDIIIELKDGSLLVSRPSDNRIHRSLHGLTRSLLANMVEGVSKGFEKVLEIHGVGYRAQKAGDKLVLQVGYSHTVEFAEPEGVSIEVEGANRVKLMGISKEAVGEAAARIRAIRRPDSYKGYGIRYAGEKVRLKPGKGGRVAAKKK